MRRISKVIVFFVIALILSSCGKKSYVVFNYNCNGEEYYKCELKKNKLDCNINTPTCEGHQFKGWYRANDDENQVDLTSAFKENEIIYARWTKGTIEEPSSINEPSSIVVTPGIIDVPSSSKEESSSSSQILPPEEPSSHIVTPQPIEETYRITFDSNGGSGQTTSLIVKYNQTLPNISNAKPAKAGHTFAGWYDSKTGGTQYYNSSNSPVRKYDKKSNTTLYAHWNACPAGKYASAGATTCTACTGNQYTDTTGQSTCKTCGTGYTVNSTHTGCIGSAYTITLDNQSATTAGTTVIYLKYNTGWYSNSGATTAITSITKPTKTGNSFKGYYTSKNGGGTQIIDSSGAILSGKTTVLNSNTTLYAHWEPYVLSIQYNGNNGTWNNPSKDTYTVNSSGSVIVKSTNKIYYQKLNYGTSLESTGLIDYNGVWFNWRKDEYTVESGKEYIINNTELDQSKVYTAVDLAKYGGCDLSKSNCTITVKVNWKSGVIIRAATYNIGYFGCGTSKKVRCKSTVAQITEMFKTHKIDIAGIQEAIPSGDVRKVGQNVGLTNYYTVVPANTNMILSRYTLYSKNETTLVTCHEKRSLQKTVVKINGVDISFYNTHYSYQSGCPAKQMNHVASIIKNDPNPVILTGDTNTSSKTNFETYLKPLGFEVAAYDTKKHGYCDSVFVLSKGHIRVVSSETVDVYGVYSDHNFVYATLAIY